jgi:hypothetical protein
MREEEREEESDVKNRMKVTVPTTKKENEDLLLYMLLGV